MKDILAWTLATLLVALMVLVVMGGAMLLANLGKTWAGVIWLIVGCLIIRNLGRKQ